MRAIRSATGLLSVLLGLLLALVLALPSQAEDESASVDALTVLCEAWRVTDPGMIGEIEAITDRDPAAAGAVRTVLRNGGADRVARILTPAAFGELLQFSDMREIAQVFSKTTEEGTTSTGLAGFHEIGTRLELKPWRRGGGLIQLELDLRMSGRGPAPDSEPIRSRTWTQIQATLSAPLGVWRMFLSRAADADVIVVLVRATALDATAAPTPEAQGEAAEGPFDEREIQRFQALLRLVDARERKEQLETTVARQLERLEVELSDEQRAVVVEMTLAYREALRDRMRSGADRESMQAAMDALRQDYADGLATVLDEATVEKVVESLGRAQGFGRRRER